METTPTAPALIKAVATPIAQLSPSVEFEKARYVRAVIMLLWPFSSTTKELKLLISEPDFRLRSAHGQIRVICRNEVAEVVAKSQAGIGDTLLLGLDGVRWEKRPDEQASFAGEAEWSLLFSERIIMEVHRDSRLFATVDVESKPQQEDKVMRDGSPTTNLGTPAVDRHSRMSTQTVASPFRLTNGSAFGFLAEEDGYIFGKGRKRTKFGRPSSEWVFVDSPPSPVEKATDWETDDIEALLQDYESPESASSSDTERPSPTPQNSHMDVGIAGVTDNTEAETPAEFLDNTVSRAGGKDVGVLVADDTDRRNGEAIVEGAMLETQAEAEVETEAEAPGVSKPSDPNERFEGVDQDQGGVRSFVSEEIQYEQQEKTKQERIEKRMDVERDGVNELEGLSPSPIQVSSHQRMGGNDYELKSPSGKEEKEPCSPPKPDLTEEAYLGSSSVLRKSKSPTLPSLSNDIDTTAPVQDSLFLVRSGSVGFERDELEQEGSHQGRLEAVDQTDLHFKLQGGRLQEASVSMQNSATEEEQDLSTKPEVVPDNVSIPLDHADTAEARDGSVSGEDSDNGMVSDREGPNVDRIEYSESDESGASSGYDSERDRAEKIVSGSEEDEHEASRDLQDGSHSNDEEDTFSDSYETDMEEYEASQQRMAQKTAQTEVIVIDSDDESDVNPEVEDDQHAQLDLEQPVDMNADSPGQPNDVSPRQDDESAISDIDGRSGKDSTPTSTKDHDAGIQQPVPERAYQWLDGAHYDISTAVSDAHQPLHPRQSVLAELGHQDHGSEHESIPAQQAQGNLESTLQPMFFDSTINPETEEQLRLTATTDSETHNETMQFEYRETLHAETQMATPAGTQEIAGISVTPPIPRSHNLPSSHMSQELNATVDTADEARPEPQTESAEIVDEPQPSSVQPDDMDIDTAPEVRGESQEPFVPTASGALLEPIKEEPPVEDFVDALSTVERFTASPTPSFESAREYSSDVEPKSEQVSQVSSPVMGRRTRLTYFCSLSSLLKSFDSAVDTMSIVVSSSPVSQAGQHPFDYYVTLHVMDPSTQGDTVCTQVFCSDEDSLPVASKGDVILLRNFKVSSIDHKAMLRSTGKISSWAVFIQGDGDNVWIAGPPVEYGDDERAYVSELRQWYLEEGAELLEKKESSLSNRASTETSITGTSDAGSTASKRGGKKKARRREKNSTPRRLTVHELRHGRRYTDASPSDKESIHELRNGTLYAHL